MAESETNHALGVRFAEALERYRLTEDLEESGGTLDDLLGWNLPSDDLLESGLGAIAAGSVSRLHSDLERLIGHGILADDRDLALFFALFIYGREAADGGAQLRVRNMRFGDLLEGMENVLIEPRVHDRDFLIDFVVTWIEHGPNPDHVEGDNSTPPGIEVQKKAALIRRTPGARSYGNLKLNRTALADLGYLVVPFENEDVERDPFAIAKRVIDDLARQADDEVYPLR